MNKSDKERLYIMRKASLNDKVTYPECIGFVYNPYKHTL